MLLWIARSPDWLPPEAPELPASVTPEALRITDPARELAAAEGVELEALPTGPLITEGWLRDWLTAREERGPIDEKAVVVYGGGGHGKAVIELLRTIGKYDVVGVIDDGLAQGEEILGVEVIGGGERLAVLRSEGVGLAANAVGGVGDMASRIRVFDRLRAADLRFPTLVHPTAFIEESATLAAGVQVFPHAYVGSSARLGFGAIVNTAAVVSHDCRLGDYVNVAPGTMLAGAVTVGEGTLIGMGVTVNLEVAIGAGARVGNGATVKRDVPAGAIVPAGSLWPLVDRQED